MNSIIDNTNTTCSFRDAGWVGGDKVKLIKDTKDNFYTSKCGLEIGGVYILNSHRCIKGNIYGGSLSGNSHGSIWEQVTSKNKNKYLVFFSDRTTLMCETTEEINKLNGVNISKVYEIARELDCETVTTKVWK